MCLCSAQSGKTVLALIYLCFLIAERPGTTLWVVPSKEAGQETMEFRMLPHLEECKPAAVKLPKNSRNGLKKRQINLGAGLSLFVRSAHTKAELQSVPARNVVCDEAGQYSSDVIPQLRVRLRAYLRNGLGKFIIITTPESDEDFISQAYRSGTQRKWFIPCDCCGEEFVFFWHGDEGTDHGGLMWDETEETIDSATGEPRLSKLLPTVRLVCPNAKCDRVWRDNEVDRRYIATANGKDPHGQFRATNEDADPGVESFAWEAGIAPWVTWASLVKAWFAAVRALKVLGDVEPMKEHIRKDRGKAWNERYRYITEAKTLRSRIVPYNPREVCATVVRPARFDGDPEAVLLPWDEDQRVMTVDVQATPAFHFRYVVRSLAPDAKSRLLDYGILHTVTELEHKEAEWEILGGRTFLDSGWAPSYVYKLCVKSGFRWNAMKGEDKDYFWQKADEGAKPYRALWNISEADANIGRGRREVLPLFLYAKYGALDRLDMFLKGIAGDWQCHPDTEEKYMREVTAYKRTDNSKKRWDKGNRPDHYASCEIMMATVANMGGLIENVPPPPPKKGRR